MKEAFQHMMEILAKLEEKNIYYKLDMVSTKHDRILIEIAIPGERWAIEIDHESNVFIEKFLAMALYILRMNWIKCLIAQTNEIKL